MLFELLDRLLKGIKKPSPLISPERQKPISGWWSVQLVNIQKDTPLRAETKVKADTLKGPEKAPAIEMELASRHSTPRQNLSLELRGRVIDGMVTDTSETAPPQKPNEKSSLPPTRQQKANEPFFLRESSYERHVATGIIENRKPPQLKRSEGLRKTARRATEKSPCKLGPKELKLPSGGNVTDRPRCPILKE
ncbi:hypothetical protein PIB30_065194 [Stylosanthes scabra]|uniref:Uncharacterized protein n=1 Tax=Stylosanthes scabra TaxID=79078 RepID=A0ABU6ZKL8_9FABA|nr:hypothetical protein [Stylosanthes scabra]